MIIALKLVLFFCQKRMTSLSPRKLCTRLRLVQLGRYCQLYLGENYRGNRDGPLTPVQNGYCALVSLSFACSPLTSPNKMHKFIPAFLWVFQKNWAYLKRNWVIQNKVGPTRNKTGPIQKKKKKNWAYSKQNWAYLKQNWSEMTVAIFLTP